MHRAGSTGSTPTLYPGVNPADSQGPAPVASTSPKQLGRPRSASRESRDVVSHPLEISDGSSESPGAVRAPLGHSLDAGALQQVPCCPCHFSTTPVRT